MDALIQRIRMMLPYVGLSEIHDRVVQDGTTEADFFLAYKAALRLESQR